MVFVYTAVGLFTGYFKTAYIFSFHCFLWSSVFCFICKISKGYTDLRCLLDFKVFTQQAKGTGTLGDYWSGESSVLFNIHAGLTLSIVTVIIWDRSKM